ncbi:MAG: efflux RND transporter periplasmic adaptor subunit [Verrucomicrobiota bacterium]|jgi:multidrug resistance efflux pump
MKRKIPLVIVIVVVLAAVLYFVAVRRGREIVLTGMVTTDEVIASSEIQGRLQELLVHEGDAVTNGQLLALIQPAEWKADLAFYTGSAEQSTAQVAQGEADLKFQESQTSNLTWQSEANLAATKDQITQAESDLENLSLTFKREEALYKQGVDSVKEYDQARTACDAAKARVQSLRKQAVAAQAAVALAKSTGEQIAARRAALQADIEQSAAAAAQKDKAAIVLGYTEIHAPIDGTVDVRAALQGEVVNPGQAIVTLINPKNLWVRADVEESYIDSVHLGDKFTVRLPSGATREGVVFYRGVDAEYATQRDVSRTKRDIRTFEIRLRCDNDDGSLAVGMTAFVLLPVGKP